MGNATRRLHRTLASRVHHFNGGADLSLLRLNPKSGSAALERCFRIGPNHVHAMITHPDGSFTDLGVSKNLLTNIGRDVMASWFGGFQPAGVTLASMVSTGISATTITDTGTVMTASNLATPQLGVAGMRVYCAPHTPTNPVVWGNAISNTTHVITVDQWWKYGAAALGVPITGTTPTSGDAYVVSPGGMASVQFIAMTTDSGAASASDTVLASEITSSGAGRALATYAHTMGASTYTLSKAFSISGTLTAIHKLGAFTALSSAGADPMIFETVLSQDATVGNGDTLTPTWSFTPSG